MTSTAPKRGTVVRVETTRDDRLNYTARVETVVSRGRKPCVLHTTAQHYRESSVVLDAELWASMEGYRVDRGF